MVEGGCLLSFERGFNNEALEEEITSLLKLLHRFSGQSLDFLLV
jgi:hypothetical protein